MPKGYEQYLGVVMISHAQTTLLFGIYGNGDLAVYDTQ